MATITNAGTGVFTPCTGKVQKYISNDYLTAKVANYMGVSIQSVKDTTGVRVDRGNKPYGNSEGVIKGMDTAIGIKGLRIDLQKEQVIAGNTYACWQVQWGTGSNGKTGGAYAGVLMLVNTTFTFADFQTALQLGFGFGKYARLDP